MKKNHISTTDLSLDEKTGTCWVLRANVEDKKIQNTLQKIELDLPQTTRLSALNDGQILAISPDEFWLIQNTEEQAEKTCEKIKKAMHEQHHGLINNSQGLRQFTLSGANSTQLLSHLIAYDWANMPTNKVISTVMHSVPIVIYKTNSRTKTPTYHILIRLSFADFAIQYIEHTSKLVA